MAQPDRLTQDFVDNMTLQSMKQDSFYDSEMYKYFQGLVTVESTPPDVKKGFWAFTDKEASLTNLTDGEIQGVLMDFDINYLMWIMSRSPREFTFEEMAKMEQAKAHLNLRLHRAKTGFERRMQSTQIREVSVSRVGDDGKKGILGRLGLFKGGK